MSSITSSTTTCCKSNFQLHLAITFSAILLTFDWIFLAFFGLTRNIFYFTKFTMQKWPTSLFLNYLNGGSIVSFFHHMTHFTVYSWISSVFIVHDMASYLAHMLFHLLHCCCIWLPHSPMMRKPTFSLSLHITFFVQFGAHRFGCYPTNTNFQFPFYIFFYILDSQDLTFTFPSYLLLCVSTHMSARFANLGTISIVSLIHWGRM